MEIDWLELWRELVTNASRSRSAKKPNHYQAHYQRKNTERPDPLLDFVLQDIDTKTTVLDVGTGSGRWAIPIAKVAKKVTAIEPSGAMLSVLRENITAARLNNVQIMQTTWEEAIIEPQDIVISAHAVYSSPGFADFINKMEKCATKRCYLAVRLPPYDGVIGELSLQIYCHRHDSPNAIIAYNALYAMGVYTNVLVENGIHRWVDSTLEEAFARAKQHLRLESTNSFDGVIRNTLARRLTRIDNHYSWPDGMRSVLLWWSPTK